MRIGQLETGALLCAALGLVACGDGGGDGDDDVGVTADAAAGTDAPADGPDAATPTPDAGSAACGTTVAPVADITGTEGIAIAPDGTIYYSQSNAIGRWQPGGSPEDDYVTLTGAGTVWGMALDDEGTLYVASPASGGRIFFIDTTDPAPEATTLLASAGAANGLVLGPDGALYYSDFSGDRVYRVDSGGERTEVTLSTLDSPNGLLFEPDGTLLVLSYSTGDVLRLTLDGAMVEVEKTRQVAGSLAGANPDGIGRDDAGRYYITDNQAGTGPALIRVDANFDNPEALLSGIPSAANIAWGRGALDCGHIYVTSSGQMRVFEGDTPGVP